MTRVATKIISSQRLTANRPEGRSRKNLKEKKLASLVNVKKYKTQNVDDVDIPMLWEWWKSWRAAFSLQMMFQGMSGIKNPECASAVLDMRMASLQPKYEYVIMLM